MRKKRIEKFCKNVEIMLSKEYKKDGCKGGIDRKLEGIL